jgi:hypothetical protein
MPIPHMLKFWKITFETTNLIFEIKLAAILEVQIPHMKQRNPKRRACMIFALFTCIDQLHQKTIVSHIPSNVTN